MTFIEFCEGFVERSLFEWEKEFASIIEEKYPNIPLYPIARGRTKNSYQELLLILWVFYLEIGKGEKDGYRR